FSRPVTGDEPGLVFGDDKYALLGRSTILVNVHRGGEDGTDDEVEYFEWARMVEAMANGCLVVTEPSTGHEPLVAGEHFVECAADDLADTVVALLADTERRDRIVEAARTAVTGSLALDRAVSDLLALADPVAQRLSGRDADERVGVDAEGVATDRPGLGWSRRLRDRVGRSGRRGGGSVRPVVRTAPPPLLPVFAPYRGLRRDVYDQLLAEIAHRRELGRFRSLLDHGDPDHVGRTPTPAWGRTTDPHATRTATDAVTAGPGGVTDAADTVADRASTAEVSVVVTVFDYADVVVDTLDSIVASHDVDVEIVIVDDASRDDSVAVVRDWMGRHPDTPVLLLTRAANQGLTRARNLAIGHARADLVMIMDADNLVYPTCLRRLADALSDDPDAAFAYSTLEAFGADPGLRSAQGWYVPWLCDANYIDAQAMIRRSTLDRFDGYRVDDTMYGWEDWDLWLRIAAAGEHGVHVPQMLGRYRTQSGSMVSLTNLAAADLRADLVARYPDLPWPPTDRP
ncbi:MAG: glycosyltransferase, partial [Ilumatobacter sp.]